MGDKDMPARLRIGKRIVELRKSRKMRQADLAEAVGIKRQALSRIEIGEVSVGVDTLQNIANYFGCDVDIVDR